MQSISDISSVGLPKSLNYDNLPSIPDSTKSYMVSVSPTGATSVTGDPLTTTVFVASDAGLVNQQFKAQNFDFNLTSGHSSNVFCDTSYTTLSGRMILNVTTAIVAGTNIKFHLISSFASFFDSLTLYSSNVPLETIYNYNILFNLLLNSTVNTAERYGSFNISSGCDVDTNSGIELPLAAGTYYFNFSIPLISVLGLNTAGSSNKLFPIGEVSNLMLRMSTTNLLPFATYCSAEPTTQPVFTTTLDSLSLNMKYIDIGDIAGAMLKQTLYDNKYFLKSTTYTGANNTISTGSFGNVTLPMQLRANSVKSLFYQFGISKEERCPNGYFDAINPNLISLQTSIGGLKHPNRPLNPSQKPAECFQAYLQAHGHSGLKGIEGIMYNYSYSSSLGVVAGADYQVIVPDKGLRGGNEIVDFPNTAYYGLDCERLNGSLFSGINTSNANLTLDVVIGTALDTTVTLYAFSQNDCVIQIDPETKTMMVLV